MIFISSCRVCGLELIGDNWYSCWQGNYKKYLCISCHKNELREGRRKKGIYPKKIKKELCNVCGIKLGNKNWHTSRKKKHDYICIVCENIRSTTYRNTHKKDAKEYQRIYREENKERIKIIHRIWMRKNNHKRKRGLKFIPLNKPLNEKCEAHHLDKEYVLYIPIKLHKSIYHNVFTGYNMHIINEKIIDWYMSYNELL